MRPCYYLVVAVILAVVAGPGAAAAADRPNVVLFIADDLGWSDCPPAGGSAPPTPNMARVAKAGMTFTHAFVASPSCAPSRAALLTGLDPVRNGAMQNHAAPRADLQKWPAYFQALGYETAAIGKVAHYAQVKQYGFDHASHFNYHQDDCVEAAVKWLAERTPDKPLCLIVGTNWPHVPWPADGWGDPAAVTLGPRMGDTPETRAAVARYHAAVANADRDLGLVYDAARKTLGDDNTLFAFSSDHGAQFPGGKWNCYDAGVRTPLSVVWPGKVKAGATTGAMVAWVDLLPTFLAAAGGTPPSAGTEAGQISGRSFLPVLLGKADDHRDHVFLTHSGDGKMNQYPQRAARTRDWKYIRNLDPDAEHHTHIDLGNPADRLYWDSWVDKAKTDPAAAAVVRAYHKRPAEELYDLKADPGETKNLAADPAHAGTLARLRAELDAWMKANGDGGMKTERALGPRPQQGDVGERARPAVGHGPGPRDPVPHPPQGPADAVRDGRRDPARPGGVPRGRGGRVVRPADFGEISRAADGRDSLRRTQDDAEDAEGRVPDGSGRAEGGGRLLPGVRLD